MNLRHRLLVLSIATILPSGCGSTPARAPGTEPVAPPTQPTPTPSASPGGALEVHEWGVIDVPPYGGSIELAAGPGEPDPPRPMRKPVLYFHLDRGAPPVTVDVVARIPRGSMLEVWPTGQLTADSITWPQLRVAPCPTPAPSVATQIAAMGTTRWATRDGYNEALELAAYETEDADCVTAGATTGRLLFYRGAIPSTPLPIEVTRGPQGLLMHASAAGTGTVIYTAAGGRGITLPWPSQGADVGLPDAFTESFEGAQLARTLEQSLTASGLTGPEAAAFMRAWSTSFFGVAPPPSNAARDIQEAGRESTRRGPMAGPAPSLIYVMPEATVASVAELTITPTPRRVRRVMVVRIELTGR